MSKIYVKMYSAYKVTGKDFADVRSSDMRRIVFSADNVHCLQISELKDGCLLISNGNKVELDFTISRNQKVIAAVKYGGGRSLLINTNWRLTQEGIENREIHSSPDLVMSNTLNFDVETLGIGRIDLKIDDSGYCACVFAEKDLLFVRMNGHHSLPRLETFIRNEMVRLSETDMQLKQKIGKEFFEECVQEHEWGLK